MTINNHRKMFRASEAAAYIGVTRQTIHNYARDGKLPYTRTPGGQRTFNKQDLDALTVDTEKTTDKQAKLIGHYARSSNGNKTLINNQLTKLKNAYGEPTRTYTDNASGLNENRRGLKRLIKDAEDGKINAIAITDKDRLTRFGYSYLETILTDRGCEILCLNDKEAENSHEELMRDFMNLIASFAGRFYRMRGYKQQKQLLDKAEKELEEKHDEQK